MQLLPIDACSPNGLGLQLERSSTKALTRYSPSRYYSVAAIASLGVALQSSWLAFQFWSGAWVLSFLFALLAGALFGLARRPVIEIHARHLRVGDRSIPWSEIHAVDKTGWLIPLIVILTLESGRRVVLLYPGDLESSRRLLRHIRRCAGEALIDGVPHDEFWNDGLEPPAAAVGSDGEAAARKQSMSAAAPRYPFLREEDEAEVERLYQRLKAVGHLDPKGPGADE